MPNVNSRPLRRIALWGQAIALVGALSVGGFSLATWFDQAALARTLSAGVPAAPVPEGGVLLAAYLVSLVPAALFVIAMVQAFRLFARLATGPVFVPQVPRGLVSLGFWACASAVAGIVVRTALGLVLTLNAPAGSRQLVIGVGSNEIAALVMALLLFAFAQIMGAAIALDEDNRGMV